ncbi:MAG: RNA-binding S4 domain-containing protein [Clostridia bacterium]|nr:RNA-binding S4 domain-containing protein [Clostridia bacterium]
MRLDKFLKVTKVIKRRTVANQAADNGRVKANEKIVKPSYEVKVGDIIEIQFGNSVSKFEILKIPTTQSVKDLSEVIKLV